ncbi:MAG: hypothetical protein EKK31_11760 [Hyphomicrobiales bacterium]|nr:MAG: hypothetical protein EKK31_11760 [Hyphomicrobiales bacterium]
MLRELPIDQIHARADARLIDEATVGGLVDSIGTIGLINPIRVRAVGDQWEVVAGHHRLAACKRLGLADIAADAIEADDLHAELAMIDENLCRAELSPADRAKHTARRKAIYLELHPETAHGTPGVSRQVGDTRERGDAERFTEATAKVTGQSERAVQRDAERGEKVIQAAIDIIRGTQLDTGTFLDKLKKLSPSEQVVVAKRELAFIKHQQREHAKGAIARRVVPLTDDEAADKQYDALVAAWNKAGETARQRFRELIDTPVMDRSAA